MRTTIGAILTILLAATVIAADFPLTRSEWVDIGQAREKQKRLDAAIYAYEQGLKADDKTISDEVLHFNAATLATQIGRQDIAIDHANAAIQSKPDYGDAYLARGNAYLRLGKTDLALEDFTTALGMKCARPWVAFNNRGLALVALGKIEEALADYARAIEANPMYMNAYWSRAKAATGQERFRPALDDYDAAIRLDSSNARLYLERAKVKKLLGDASGAVADFDSARVLDPHLSADIEQQQHDLKPGAR